MANLSPRYLKHWRAGTYKPTAKAQAKREARTARRSGKVILKHIGIPSGIHDGTYVDCQQCDKRQGTKPSD